MFKEEDSGLNVRSFWCRVHVREPDSTLLLSAAHFSRVNTLCSGATAAPASVTVGPTHMLEIRFYPWKMMHPHGA